MIRALYLFLSIIIFFGCSQGLNMLGGSEKYNKISDDPMLFSSVEPSGEISIFGLDRLPARKAFLSLVKLGKVELVKEFLENLIKHNPGPPQYVAKLVKDVLNNGKMDEIDYPLGIAIKTENNEMFEYLLSQEYLDVNRKCKDDSIGNISFLHMALKQGSLYMFARLLDKEANFNDNYYSLSLPAYAILCHKTLDEKSFVRTTRIIDIPTYEGGNINDIDKNGFTLLYYAFTQGKDDIVTYLKEKGAEFTVQDKYQSNISHWIVRECPKKDEVITLLDKLVANGLDIRQLDIRETDKYQKSILYKSISRNQVQPIVVEYLLNNFYNKDEDKELLQLLVNFAGKQAKEYYSLEDYQEILKIFKEFGFTPSVEASSTPTYSTNPLNYELFSFGTNPSNEANTPYSMLNYPDFLTMAFGVPADTAPEKAANKAEEKKNS
jgi:hypothetical protein